MKKLIASIIKDCRLLIKDKTGLLLLFLMPVVLVLLITALQNNTFKIVNDHQLPLMVVTNDTGSIAKEFITAIDEVGMFDLSVSTSATKNDVLEVMESSDALVLVMVSNTFTVEMTQKAEILAAQALSDLGLGVDDQKLDIAEMPPLKMYYSPVLQESYRYAMESALRSALQLVESKQMLKVIYKSINNSEMPAGFDRDLADNQTAIEAVPLSSGGHSIIPNASQHNVPAWTIFAMYFMVISLGGSLIKEKLSGSFIRLKTMPGGYFRSIISKQWVYLIVALLQVAVIFSIGHWLFPFMGLPALNIPDSILALIVVSLVCGLSAVSYALVIGVYANTQEQGNGFGAVSVVILAALGGILVPSFAMPEAFRMFTVISPLHWCLESYYGLFLTNGNLKDVTGSLVPLILIIITLQGVAFLGLKRKNLI